MLIYTVVSSFCYLLLQEQDEEARLSQNQHID